MATNLRNIILTVAAAAAAFLVFSAAVPARAAISASWIATSTNKGFIAPNAINGNFPSVLIGATTTTGTGSLQVVTGSVGIGTTTPWGKFSIAALSTATNPTFAISTSTASATSTAVVVDANGKVGIGTSSPLSTFSVVGEVNQYGNYVHFGPVPSNDVTYCVSGKQCDIYAGNDNTLAGVGRYVANYNAGASSYSIFQLENDRTDASGTHYAGISLNSSGYNDTTYGTAFNVPDVFQTINSDGATSFITNTNNVAGRTYFNFVGGGSSASNEFARINTTGFGYGTTSPHAALSVNAGNTSPTKNLIEASVSGGATNNATTTVFTVASSSAAFAGIGTSTKMTANSVLTVTGGTGATTTLNFGNIGDTTANLCINVPTPTGTNSFYFRAGGMIVDPAACK